MCARFTAFRRVKRNRDASKVAETLFSASIIGISLIALMSNNLEVSKNISVFTIIFSTFCIMMSRHLKKKNRRGRSQITSINISTY